MQPEKQIEINGSQPLVMASGDAVGLLEISGLSPAMAALDAMEKSAPVRLLQVESNDLCGVVLKVTGQTAAVQAAVHAGERIARSMGVRFIGNVINAPDTGAWSIIESKAEFNSLIETQAVLFPRYEAIETASDRAMEQFAIGLIETQGFTAVFEAIDAACKAANVEVIGKEKLGGGYITVIIRGDVAAVRAAVEAGQSHVEGLGHLIAAHVIPRPSEGVLSLLPKA